MISVKKNYSEKEFTNLENRFKYDRVHLNNKNNNSVIRNIPSKDIDYYIVKPYGKKCYLWFTYIDKKFVSLLKYVNDNDFYLINLVFDNTLSYNNVLLYGYYINIENNYFFIIDNIINYNEYNYLLYTKNFVLENTFKLFNLIFNMLDNNYSNKSLRVFLPYITNNYNNIFSEIYNLAYKPYIISFWKDNKNLGIYTFTNSSNKIDAIFKIKASNNHDTYNLYCLNNNKLEIYSNCLIPTYKLSIYMNKLFRKIIENVNLDYLEESEDEDTFENIDENKFVNLEKEYYFKCYYNKRFNKWIPKNVIENCQESEVITKKQLFYIEKK
tara:strand:- start:4180 stop:5157 length:978 start_codon:yes stop_codon:yes gene_type:complete